MLSSVLFASEPKRGRYLYFKKCQNSNKEFLKLIRATRFLKTLRNCLKLLFSAQERAAAAMLFSAPNVTWAQSYHSCTPYCEVNQTNKEQTGIKTDHQCQTLYKGDGGRPVIPLPAVRSRLLGTPSL